MLVDLTVAGPSSVRVHRADMTGAELDFLPAAVARFAGLRPRREIADAPLSFDAALFDEDPEVRARAMEAVGARFAWRLVVDDAELTVVDGHGIRLLDPATGTLVPTTNTAVYRLLSTIPGSAPSASSAATPMPASSPARSNGTVRQ